MEASSITILGGDSRQCYAAEYFSSLGMEVICYHTPDFPYRPDIIQAGSLAQALAHSNLILAPTPLTRDGVNLMQAKGQPPCLLENLWETLTPHHRLAIFSLTPEYRKILEGIGCESLIFGNSHYFQQENARLTAEGLLSEVIRHTPFALSSANILLLGYGRCGTAIGRIFLPLCQNIYVIEQNMGKWGTAKLNGLTPVCREDFPRILPKCQAVINTVPAPVLETEQLSQLHSSCHIFDIASAPFGFPADITEKCLLPYFQLPGIPGRFCPATAGKIIGRTIERMTEHAI